MCLYHVACLASGYNSIKASGSPWQCHPICPPPLLIQIGKMKIWSCKVNLKGKLPRAERPVYCAEVWHGLWVSLNSLKLFSPPLGLGCCHMPRMQARKASFILHPPTVNWVPSAGIDTQHRKSRSKISASTSLTVQDKRPEEQKKTGQRKRAWKEGSLRSYVSWVIRTSKH